MGEQQTADCFETPELCSVTTEKLFSALLVRDGDHSHLSRQLVRYELFEARHTGCC